MERFDRLINLLGEEDYIKIRNATVLIIGLGGVGGYALESLVRTGVEKLILVDYDTVDLTNINRQIIADDTTIGLKKVDVWTTRILNINPHCQITKIDLKVDENNFEELFKNDIDYLIDACDTITVKKRLIQKCLANNIKFISSMGMGRKTDPTKVQICELKATSHDPIAKILRKFIRDEKITEKVMVVSSDEEVSTPNKVITSMCFVPAVAGLLSAKYIIDLILKEK